MLFGHFDQKQKCNIFFLFSIVELSLRGKTRQDFEKEKLLVISNVSHFLNILKNCPFQVLQNGDCLVMDSLFTTQSRFLTTLRQNPLENIVVEGEKGW